MFPEMAGLRDQGVNIWYDEGIPVGREWTQELAQAIEGCAKFLYFISPASVESRHCRNEAQYALSHNKPVVSVYLEPTDLPGGLQLSIGPTQALFKHDLSEAAFREKLHASLADRDSPPEVEVRSGFVSPEANFIEQLSIAVVPLDNRTGNPELDSLGESIAEDLTDMLARTGLIAIGLRLIGGHETLELRNRAVSASDIATELKVGAVLTGSMRKLGTTVRLTVELVSATGEQIWRHPFDEPFDSIFDQQNRIVDMIVWGFTQGFDRYLASRVVAIPTESLGPGGLYGKACATANFADAKARAESRRLFERAIELSPHNPVFKGVLAQEIALGVANGFSTNRDADTQRALELAEDAANSDIGVALVSASRAFGALGDHERSVALCRLCHEMAPRYVPWIDQLATALLLAGEPADALHLYDEIEMLMLPGQTSSLQQISQCHLMLGNLDEALKTAQNAINRGGGPFLRINMYTILASTLACADRVDEAVAMIERARQLVPQLTIRKSIKAYRRQFGTEEARNALTRGLQKLIDLGYD